MRTVSRVSCVKEVSVCDANLVPFTRRRKTSKTALSHLVMNALTLVLLIVAFINNSLASTIMKTNETGDNATPASYQESNLGRFYDVEPQWKGSSYSYVRPTKCQTRNRKDASSTSTLATIQTLEFPVCGSITIEQHSDRVSPNGTTGTGFALWSSALAVSEYLDARFANDAVPSWKEFVQNASNTPSCLELGAGLGLPSIVLARHGFHVVATDHEPEVLSLLEQNVRVNLQQDDSFRKNATHLISVEPLDWARFRERQIAPLAPDLIIASDVIWNGTRPIWRDFLSLLNRLRQNRKRRKDYQTEPSLISLPRCDNTPTPRSDPLVLLGYTQRRLDMTAEEESNFFALLHQYGMHVRILPPDVAPYSDHWPLTVLMELRWES